MQVFVKEIVVLRSPVCRFQGLKLLRVYHLRKKVVDDAEALRCGKILHGLMLYQEAEHAFIDKTGRHAPGKHLAGQHPSCGGALGKALVIKPGCGIGFKLLLVAAGRENKEGGEGPLHEGLSERAQASQEPIAQLLPVFVQVLCNRLGLIGNFVPEALDPLPVPGHLQENLQDDVNLAAFGGNFIRIPASQVQVEAAQPLFAFQDLHDRHNPGILRLRELNAIGNAVKQGMGNIVAQFIRVVLEVRSYAAERQVIHNFEQSAGQLFNIASFDQVSHGFKGQFQDNIVQQRQEIAAAGLPA